MNRSLRTLSGLVFWSLLQTQLCRGQSLIGSSQPIVATVGEDVILPCAFNPPRDVAGLTLEWTRPDLDPRFVYVRRSHEELTVLKNPHFIGRTFLFTDELKNGNISLKLTNIKPLDSGKYRCFIPTLGTETSVNLAVGSSSPPVVSVSVDVWRSAVVLQCDSGAWYPEPELLWLDSEGRLLSAERTHTHTRPDGLYNVSSRVTVEQSSTFTCRVSQSSTNITRENSFQVPDELFVVNFWPLVIGLAAGLTVCLGVIIIIIIVFASWKRKNIKSQSTEAQRQDADREEISKLQAETESLRKEVETLNSQLEKTKEPQKNKCGDESDIIIESIDPNGTHVCLRNTSEKLTHALTGWKMTIEVDKSQRYVYIFKVVFLKAGSSVTVCAKDHCKESDDKAHLEWRHQSPWNTGHTAVVSLYNKYFQLIDRKSQDLQSNSVNEL